LKITPLTNILSILIKKDKHKIFYEPVDGILVPDYYQIIKNPICFSVMLERMKSGEYKTPDIFEKDLQLLCYNAKLYNPPYTIFYKEADRILNEGKKLLIPLQTHGNFEAQPVAKEQKNSDSSETDVSGFEEKDSSDIIMQEDKVKQNLQTEDKSQTIEGASKSDSDSSEGDSFRIVKTVISTDETEKNRSNF